MSREVRTLRIEFATEETFQREYAANIANGGIFVATRSAFAVREPVCVQVSLGWVDQRVALDGEVVHVVPPELAETGATPGVAVQFSLPASEIRDQFRSWIGQPEEPNERLRQSGRRSAPRTPARVPVRIETSGRLRLEGRTRNLSATGALVSSQGDPPPVGTAVQITLTHPVTRESMPAPGRVARHVVSETGEVTALAIHFEAPEAVEAELRRFISDVKASEHSRRLGGISGPISEIGIENVLQMFGACSPQGTLTLTRGVEDGVIVFEGGMLRRAQVRELEGLKALAELLSWTEGHFEFQSRIEDEGVPTSEPVSLEAAILDAIRQLDERARDAGAPADRGGRTGTGPALDDALVEEALSEAGHDLEGAPAEIDRGAAMDWVGGNASGLSTTEEAIRDLARVGMTVGKALSVIPETEETLLEVLASLVARDLVRLHR